MLEMGGVERKLSDYLFNDCFRGVSESSLVPSACAISSLDFHNVVLSSLYKGTRSINSTCAAIKHKDKTHLYCHKIA